MLETVIENNGLPWLIMKVFVRETHRVVAPVKTQFRNFHVMK